MSVFVRTGRGYEPADIRDDENNTVMEYFLAYDASDSFYLANKSV